MTQRTRCKVVDADAHQQQSSRVEQHLIAVVEHALYVGQPPTDETLGARALWEHICAEQGWT